jgi:hypothetical protein
MGRAFFLVTLKNFPAFYFYHLLISQHAFIFPTAPLIDEKYVFSQKVKYSVLLSLNQQDNFFFSSQKKYPILGLTINKDISFFYFNPNCSAQTIGTNELSSCLLHEDIHKRQCTALSVFKKSLDKTMDITEQPLSSST